jgi:ATP-dependent Clp protease protease subunit
MAQKANDAPREWYRIANQAEDPSVVEIEIYDFIGDWIDDYWGFGITAKAFIEQLKNLPESVKTIRLRVNSPGGDFYSATAIANLLRDQQATKGRIVEGEIDAMAASAATIITSAVSKGKLRIADTALMFVHNPLTILIGFYYASSLRKLADDLDKVSTSIITAYQWRSALEDTELRALMDAETLMDADEAVAKGFADEKVAGLPAMNVAYDRRGDKTVKAMPEAIRSKIEARMQKPAPAPEAPKPAEATAVLAACREAGCLELAEGLIAAGATGDQVRATVQEEQTARTARAEREKQIRAVCVMAKHPERAEQYIRAEVSVEFVKSDLAYWTAKLDKVEIDTHLQPDAERSAQRARLNPSAIYAERAARPGQRGA